MFRLFHTALECPVYFHSNSGPSLTTTLNPLQTLDSLWKTLFVFLSSLSRKFISRGKPTLYSFVTIYLLTVSIMESENNGCAVGHGKRKC